MTQKSSTDYIHRFRVTLELMEVAHAMMRQNISRALPGADKKWIDSEMLRWVREQPSNFIPQYPRTSPGSGKP